MNRNAPPLRNLIDRLIAEVDSALRVVAAPARGERESPAAATATELDPGERALSGALMRVNHAGEISAQALYRGQAFVARDPELRRHLLQAAADENDHLAWCEDRLSALGDRKSALTPLWYAGSFAIGALAALVGDRVSLGFLHETERQVTEHLDSHLSRLPTADVGSRQVVTQMRADEAAHGEAAVARGAAELPEPARAAMRLASRFMTTVAHRI